MEDFNGLLDVNKCRCHQGLRQCSVDIFRISKFQSHSHNLYSNKLKEEVEEKITDNMALLLFLTVISFIARLRAAINTADHATYYGFQEYRDRCTAIAVGNAFSSYFIPRLY